MAASNSKAKSRNKYVHPLYRAWIGIRARCLDPNHYAYKDYGGRGIRIFDGWVNDLEAFAAHVGERPSPRHSLDRIDNNGHYEPGNVRWATQEQQCSNKRNNRFVIWRGERYTVTQLARKIAYECENADEYLFINEFRRMLMLKDREGH